MRGYSVLFNRPMLRRLDGITAFTLLSLACQHLSRAPRAQGQGIEK